MRTITVLFLTLLLHGYALALTIATGSAEGTYFKIAQDIKQVAEKEGIPIEVIQTNGSFENVNLLGAGKVDLAIMQLDVLRFVAEIMLKETGLNVLQETKVVLNLYPEEIHIITKNGDIRTIQDLQGKKVAVGPEKGGSALTAEVLLAGFNLNVERVFDAPDAAIKKLGTGDLDALIFIGGAPVPAFRNLDKTFHFVAFPPNSGLEQIYIKKKIEKSVYPWADDFETYAVPSVIMTRNRDERDYAVTLQKLVLSILVNKEKLDVTGHPKWKDSYVRSTLGGVGYSPTTDVIQLYNVLDSVGYRIIKK
ncbi:MAG: TAXI family TRAP transporter solute-binding subunit [Deltaproteobacteria bacterium]|jgi:TRAP transporter TAXI family solute receptor|nr:MAG: TAXI family TRAP transporter solute-binding subunit [Deltaproteobacteria bacterium]